MPKPDKIIDGIKPCKICGKDCEHYHYEFMGKKILITDVCLECRDKEISKQKMAEEKREQIRIGHEREEWREKCGIPPRYVKARFENFTTGWQDNALTKCQEYANEYPMNSAKGYRSLFLWSTTSWGTGKTHLASSICHKLFDRWDGKNHLPRIIFTSEPDLFRRIQATYSYNNEEQRNKESESDIINQIARADLVVLDDVGKEPRSDMRFVRRTLFAIINSRYDNDLPLIITANLNPQGLREHLDESPTEASFNRFISMIKQKHIHMDGKSYRRNLDGKI